MPMRWEELQMIQMELHLQLQTIENGVPYRPLGSLQGAWVRMGPSELSCRVDSHSQKMSILKSITVFAVGPKLLSYFVSQFDQKHTLVCSLLRICEMYENLCLSIYETTKIF